VMLWLNGGPGCSSLDGYLYEQGPFHVNESDHSQLYYNPYTWAKQVNIVFLESPAGVGFSFSKTSSDLTTNDTQTAEDNFNFLVNFFKAYPEYQANDFYIAGESYAGIYVPMLAERVTEGNQKGQSNINLKGFMVGNGCTGNDVGICGGLDANKIDKDYLFWHGLVSIDLSNKADAACGDYSNPDTACAALLNDLHDAIGNVNIYDIYAPCIEGGMTPEDARVHSRANRVPHNPSRSIVGGPDGCIDGIAAAAYLNTAAVQSAIHVTEAVPFAGQWAVCSSKVRYRRTATNLPGTIYPGLISKYKTLIFNGDTDACVPYNDNEIWTSAMGYEVSSAWHSWTLDQQVAGYATVYTVPGAAHPFTFVTVKGSGHMVPEYQPESAFEMLRRFLNDIPF